MSRVFLSHSAKDKETYVSRVFELISEKLGTDNIVYDEKTFVAGEKFIDEINRTLEITDLFVLFLSDSALDSPWVSIELSSAAKKLDEKKLDRIYPIIVDPKIRYDDKRIPEWLHQYNLKYIARPAKTAKLIVERIKNINWTRHPEYLNRQNIFVGRNELIQDFENRIDDFEKDILTTLFVSGLRNIGRKSLSYHCLKKGNIINNFYEFSRITLNKSESIEDFLYKINDLGLNSETDLKNLMRKSVDAKVAIAIKMMESIAQTNEIILVQDDGCIVDYMGEVADWFKSIVSSKGLSKKMLFVVVCRFRVNWQSIRSIGCIFHLQVPELKKSERIGLLKRELEANQLTLTKEDMKYLAGLLSGYPAQVHYAVEIVKHYGFMEAQNRSSQIADFSTQEVTTLLEEFKDDPKAFDLIALISGFDALSIDMLNQIISDDIYLLKLFERFFMLSFCEYVGVNNEYVRINEVIRDYIARSAYRMNSDHKKIINKILREKFLVEDFSSFNISEFLYGIRECVIRGKDIPQEYVIPSVYLRGMQDYYEIGKFSDVVRLANLALENETYTDRKIIFEIRYSLCSALAKLQDKKFLTEVQNITGPEHNFLLAFYYRQIGKNDKAMENLNKVLEMNSNNSQAKRELVLVYKNLQEFDKAMLLAKENYYYYQENPYHIQAYFDCVIKSTDCKTESKTLEELLIKIKKIRSKKAQSMAARCDALYMAFIKENEEEAFLTIEQAIENFPNDKNYGLEVKFEIADTFQKTKIMQNIIDELKKSNCGKNTIIIMESRLFAKKGDLPKAIKYFNNNIVNFTPESMKAFCNRLQREK